MTKQPASTPWGSPNTVVEFAPGFTFVRTEAYAGIMVKRDAAAHGLSPLARRYGTRHGDYLCYEYPHAAPIVLTELLDTKGWPAIAPLFSQGKGQEQAANYIELSLLRHYPQYAAARRQKQRPVGEQGNMAR